MTRAARKAREASPVMLHEPKDADALLRRKLAKLEQEEFWVVSVGIRNNLMGHEMIARGTLAGVEVHPRDVFRTAIRTNAAAIIVAHNHPSGDPTPSPEDIALTKRLIEVGNMVGIPVIDHLVIASSGYRSIAELLPGLSVALR